MQDEALRVELKPCPFCGMPPRTCPDTSYGSATVFCPDENECAVGPVADALIAEGGLRIAIERWNTRSSPRIALGDDREAIARVANAHVPEIGDTYLSMEDRLLAVAELETAILSLSHKAVDGGLREALQQAASDFHLIALHDNVRSMWTDAKAGRDKCLEALAASQPEQHLELREELEWCRTEIFSLCESVEDDPILEKALAGSDHERGYARGQMKAAKSIRRAMSDVLGARLSALATTLLGGNRHGE